MPENRYCMDEPNGCRYFRAYGLYIDEYAAAYIRLSVDKATDEIPPEIEELVEDGTFDARARLSDLPYGYSDIVEALECLPDDACCLSGLDGHIGTLFPEKAITHFDFEFEADADDVLYIPAEREPDLFAPAYESPDELLNKLKAAAGAAGVEFPADFDWWARVVRIDAETVD